MNRFTFLKSVGVVGCYNMSNGNFQYKFYDQKSDIVNKSD